VTPTRAVAGRPLAIAVPFAVMAAVAAADLAAGPAYGLLPLFSLSPALAAVLLSPVRTAVMGLLALAACLPLIAYDGELDSRHAIVCLASIAGVTAAGAVASAIRLRRERELADVRAVADVVQQVLLRPPPGRIGRAGLAVRCLSASSSAQVGGDLYEVVAAGDAIRIIVGDVQGRGLAAVGAAAVVLGAFREHAHDARGLADIAAAIELSMQRQPAAGREKDGEAEGFVTAVLAEVPPGSPAEIEILSCGHPPPLLLGAAGARYLETADWGLPLGLAHLSASPRTTTRHALVPGDRILFYTDGICEARDRAGRFFSLDAAAATLRGRDLDVAVDQLARDVVRHVGRRLSDDATALLVGWDITTADPPSAGPGARRMISTPG
jgi:serine phosphatase RsbU (regulator of sigma subunit)